MSAKTKYFSVLIRVSLREKILDGKKYRDTVPFKGQGWTGVGIDLFLKDLYLVIKQTPPRGISLFYTSFAVLTVGNRLTFFQ